MGSKFSVARMRKELAAQTMTTVTTSGDILAGGFSLYDVGTIAASGSSQATAQAIVNHVTMVSAADGTKGVVLPIAVTNGEFYAVGNTVANQTLKLYPSTGSAINAGALDASINVTGSGAALCFYASSSLGAKWLVIDRGLT
jgi:hypothetical protein